MKLKKISLLLPLIALGLISCGSRSSITIDPDLDVVTPDDPETPTDPDTPEEPVTPSDPEDPIDPTDPTDPETPEEPTDPTDPTDPEDPEDPTDPETPIDYTALIESLLETLQSDPLIYELTLSMQGSGYVYESTIQGYISSNRYWYEEINSGVQYDTMDLWRTDDGYVGEQKLDLETNEVLITTTDANTVFDETYYNPFDLVKTDGASYADNVVSFDIGGDTGETILYLLTAWSIDGSVNVATLDVTVDESTEEISKVVLNLENGTATINLSLVDEEDISMPAALTSRDVTDDTINLQSALDALANAESLYTTVIYTDTQENESREIAIHYDSSSGSIVAIEDGADGFGALNTSEGIATFDYVSGGYAFATGIDSGQVSDLVPSYTVLGCMFDLQNDGSYLFAIDGQEDELVDLLLIESYVLGSSVYPDTGTLSISITQSLDEISGVSYSYVNGSSTINVSVVIDGATVSVSESSLIDDSVLHRFIVQNFSDPNTMSYTQTRSSGTRRYTLDPTTEEIIDDEPIISETSSDTIYVDKNARRVGEYGASGSTYYVNIDTGYMYYYYSDVTQRYVIGSEAYANSGYMWQERLYSARSWRNYLNYFTAESDTVSVCLDNSTIASVVASILALSDSSRIWNTYDTTITYDETEGTITVEVVYYTEKVEMDSTTYYVESYISSTYSNIGSTVVDISFLD